MTRSGLSKDNFDPALQIKLMFVAVFVLASALRLSLAVVNREALDDHFSIINLTLQNNRFPDLNDCAECFQPKLFYSIVVGVVRLAQINIDHPNSIILAAQLINFVAGELLLFLVYLMIRKLGFQDSRVGLVAFAVIAFNPTLIAENGMASNDTFAILFSSLAIYFNLKYLSEHRLMPLVFSGIFVILGISTKTNIICTGLAIFGVLLLRGIVEKRLSEALVAVLFVLGFAAGVLVNPLSQYWSNLQKYGTPVTLSVAREPFPSLFLKTYVRRPGIVSIQDGLFTFKFIDLLEYPRLTLGATGYPSHRTSLWTDLYGSANSVHFFNSPDSWHTRPDFETTRAIFILALVPTGLLVFGSVYSLKKLFESILTKSRSALAERYYGMFDIVLVGYILFLIALALQYRDFSTMKAVYIYPALFSFLYLFLMALNEFYHWAAQRNKIILALFEIIVCLLVVFYTIDVCKMIVHLYGLNLA